MEAGWHLLKVQAVPYGATGINGVPNEAGLQGSDVRPESFDIAFLPQGC